MSKVSKLLCSQNGHRSDYEGWFLNLDVKYMNLGYLHYETGTMNWVNHIFFFIKCVFLSPDKNGSKLWHKKILQWLSGTSVDTSFVTLVFPECFFLLTCLLDEYKGEWCHSYPGTGYQTPLHLDLAYMHPQEFSHHLPPLAENYMV